jgi:hypothetical protein
MAEGQASAVSPCTLLAMKILGYGRQVVCAESIAVLYLTGATQLVSAAPGQVGRQTGRYN